MQILFEILLFITGVFLILLVLVQRGKGGGLAGAFGGMGGQSAFGTKAGDLFTRITIGVAAFWIILCAAVVWYMSHSKNPVSSQFGHTRTETTAPEKPSAPAPGGAPAAPGGAPAAPAAPAGGAAAPVQPGGQK